MGVQKRIVEVCVSEFCGVSFDSVDERRPLPSDWPEATAWVSKTSIGQMLTIGFPDTTLTRTNLVTDHFLAEDSFSIILSRSRASPCY